MTALRWPLEPVDAHLRRTLGAKSSDRDVGGYSARNVAAVLRLNERTWQRYLAAGEVSDLVAERMAHALGVGPEELWQDWHTRYLAELGPDELTLFVA